MAVALLLSAALFISGGCSSVENITPASTPKLKPDLVREVMLFGGTGTIGDGILKALLADKRVSKVYVVTRRETDRIKAGAKSGKVVVLKHLDYLDYGALNERLKSTRTVYWALGTSASNVDDAMYTKIHVDFPAAFFKSWLSANKAGADSFHLITGAGTSTDSWFHWAREKGKAELRLKQMAATAGIKVVAYRPGFIIPTSERSGFAKQLFFPLLGGIKSRHIGQSMLEATMRPLEITNGAILNASSIKDFAEAYRRRNKLDD